MMISSAFAKCSIAIILFVQASAFISPSATSAGRGAAFSAATAVAKHPPFQTQQLSTVEYQRDISCYATSKRENCPGKTAFDNKNNIGGIGGLNISRPTSNNKKIVSSTPKKSIKKNISKNKKITKSTGDNEASQPKPEIDWGKILLAFLTPWRNPNSLFLYLLIIVSVLGKLNENPQ
mmetsp:Transcript_18241/g.32145  ORF Transcript_18241/g.32145 Transcript_18241/m.32145 type:complete len:178 (+) Transcript_18241:83-616(+)